MPLGCERVLVVDDDADFREVLGEVLREAGAVVKLASGPDAALDVLRSGFAPKLVLVDVQPGGANGRDVLTRLRAHRAIAHVPVVIMSGAPGVAATVPEADEVLVKPFDLASLYRTVSRLCRRTG